MKDQAFRDYYKILQVHYDASFEVIQAAYERLTTVTNSDSVITDYREAFHILGDPELRKQYHKIWALYFTEQIDQIRHEMLPYTTSDVGLNTNSNDSISITMLQSSLEHATEIMDSFMNALQFSDFTRAYYYITNEDKEDYTQEDIELWRESYHQCYQFERYQIDYTRTYKDCKLDNVLYDNVIEFKVTIHQLNLVTDETETEVIRKCTAFDGSGWRVWLGNENIRKQISFYQDYAKNHKRHSGKYQAEMKTDPLTGMLNEYGFYITAKKEVARTKRYSNPFTLLAFQLNCQEEARETACLCQLSTILKKALRITDIAARLNNKQIICLLTETRKFNGDAAANRFLRLIREQQSEQYTVGCGVVFFGGFTELKDAVSTACSIAACSPDLPPDGICH